ncbi:MAG: phosphoserine phosphatase SerB [Rhizobiaceae bacterium]|nr:phosphoserine phosphatase SerB [Rhizobiaceae bacterium]
MFVATFISGRAAPGLPEALVRDLAAQLGGTPVWLEPGIACDIRLDAKPFAETLRAVEATAREAKLDCVVQEAAGRRKGILIADMDSTMIGEECIDELAAFVGLKDEVAAITTRAMNGEIAFEPALIERVALLKGLPETVIADVLAHRISYAPGGAELVATMRANGAYAALVSGGFTAFTSVVAAHLGFDENRANRLDIEAGCLAGTVTPPILGREAKVEALLQIAASRGLTPSDAIAVGDGANDLGMIGVAGTGVAIHAKPTVAAAAPFHIDHGDLTALLFLQGYAVSDFVT